HEPAVRGDQIDAEHAHARRPERSAVPAEAALQEISSDGDAAAVTGGKEKPPPSAQGAELLSGAPPAGGRAHPPLVDRDLIEPRDIEEESAVPDVISRPAVTARAHADAQALAPGQLNRGHDVVYVFGLHDHIRVAGRQARVPHRRAARGFVSWRVAAEG